MGRLDGKVAIVTGASGGIGKAITKEFIEEGCIVVGFNYTPSSENIDARFYHEYILDITDRNAVESAVKNVVQKLGG